MFPPFLSISWVCFHLHWLHCLTDYLCVMGLPQIYKVVISHATRRTDKLSDFQTPYYSLQKDSGWPQLGHMPILEHFLDPGEWNMLTTLSHISIIGAGDPGTLIDSSTRITWCGAEHVPKESAMGQTKQ